MSAIERSGGRRPLKKTDGVYKCMDPQTAQKVFMWPESRNEIDDPDENQFHS